MSFITNFHRMGTMVLISHDIADIFLELAKLMKYAEWNRCTTVAFIGLFFTWIIPRNFYFPFVIIRSTIATIPKTIQKGYKWTDFFQQPIMYRLILGMLCILACLHVYWTVLLLKAAYKSIKEGKEVDDIREESDDDEEIEKKKV